MGTTDHSNGLSFPDRIILCYLLKVTFLHSISGVESPNTTSMGAIHLLSADLNPWIGSSFPPAAFQSQVEMLGLRMNFQGLYTPYPAPLLVLLYLQRVRELKPRANPLVSASEVPLPPEIQASWKTYQVKSLDQFLFLGSRKGPAHRAQSCRRGSSASERSIEFSRASSGS